MLYTTKLKRDLIKHLDLLDDESDFLDLLIETSIITILSYTNREEEEINTNKNLYKLIFLDCILNYNKRFNEGLSSQSTSGFSKNYKDLEQNYKMLLTVLNKVKVI